MTARVAYINNKPKFVRYFPFEYIALLFQKLWPNFAKEDVHAKFSKCNFEYIRLPKSNIKTRTFNSAIELKRVPYERQSCGRRNFSQRIEEPRSLDDHSQQD